MAIPDDLLCRQEKLRLSCICQPLLFMLRSFPCLAFYFSRKVLNFFGIFYRWVESVGNFDLQETMRLINCIKNSLKTVPFKLNVFCLAAEQSTIWNKNSRVGKSEKYLLYETFPLSPDELIYPSWNNRHLHQVCSETEGCAEIQLYACISGLQQQPVAHRARHPGLALTHGTWKNQSTTENSAQERKHLQPKSWSSHLPSSCNNHL